MHNYCTATCYTLSEESTLQTFHQIDIPKLGFSHEHVLHAILGLSAMHLAHFRPMMTQTRFQSFALRKSSIAVLNVTKAMSWRSGIHGALSNQSS
jgi:hypothetical protein